MPMRPGQGSGPEAQGGGGMDALSGGPEELMTKYGNLPQNGQPGTGLWKHAALGVAAPLLALLGSKLSKGSMGFGEGLAHFGKGFADTKYGQAMESRKR